MTKPKKIDKANDDIAPLSLRQRKAPKEETLRHREVFEIYYAMGDARSLKMLSDIVGVTNNNIELWSSTFGWVDRVQARDQELIRRIQDDYKDEILRYRCWYIDIVKSMIQGCLTFDKDGKPSMSIKPTTVSDLEKLIKLHMALMGDDGKQSEGSGNQPPGSGGGTMNVQIVMPQQLEQGQWAAMASKSGSDSRLTIVQKP